MNERIKELMDQATRSKYWNATTQVMTEDFDKEMFAELIVRECAYIARQCYTVRAVEAEDVAKHIEETFWSLKNE
jgi:hypothetical protein